jgi:AcrR family transcriptional regulator
MPDDVKGRRAYHSPRRQEQAALTRRQILEAAQDLFERQGYAATPMSAIAAQAQVALKTVYLVFETKSGLLRALWDLTLGGADDAVPVVDRPWYREMMDAPDAKRILELNARNSRLVKSRAAGLMRVIRDAASADADAGALWSLIQQEFHANQATVVQAIKNRRALRPGLTVKRATDILWTLNHPDLWQLLVVGCGWTPEAFEKWQAETFCAQLLR